MQFQVNDSEAMQLFGVQLGQCLAGADIVVLDGPLGAGKTTLVQGIGLGLGVLGAITSPTFVVSRVHKPGTREIGLVHVDAYRLDNATDLLDMDLDDQPSQVLVIEWGRPFIDAISDRWMELEISRTDFGSDDDPASGQRTIDVSFHGAGWDHVSAVLR